MPCVVRTFLPALSEAEERDDGTACCTAKIVNPDKMSIVSEIDIFVYKISGAKVQRCKGSMAQIEERSDEIPTT